MQLFAGSSLRWFECSLSARWLRVAVGGVRMAYERRQRGEKWASRLMTLYLLMTRKVARGMCAFVNVGVAMLVNSLEFTINSPPRPHYGAPNRPNIQPPT